MFNCSPLFYNIFESKEKVLINQGGTSSSKTYSIMQLLFYKAVTEQRSVITVAGESLPNLRKGAYRDAENIFADNKYLQSQLKFWNKTERIIYFKNGSLIEFVSFENEQSAKNGKRDYLFVNEANGISYQIYWQLAIRTKNQIYIDYNPTNEFWAHTKLIGQPDTKLIISDHRHNPFLSEEDHERIEAIKDLDLELWRVYARGMTGKIEGVIFRNWAICEKIPEDAELIAFAIDFGFTNDPTGIIEVYKSGGELWVNEMCYETRLTNMDICRKLRDFGVTEDQEIIADSAEPKSIQEIYAEGFNIHGAMKGPDSIKQGIDILKRYKINITANSHNFKKELFSYIWKKDKTGRMLNEPIDAFNHLIDPLRYVALNKLASKIKQEYSFDWN
jgi:phage terminase large subunit